MPPVWLMASAVGIPVGALSLYLGGGKREKTAKEMVHVT